MRDGGDGPAKYVRSTLVCACSGVAPALTDVILSADHNNPQRATISAGCMHRVDVSTPSHHSTSIVAMSNQLEGISWRELYNRSWELIQYSREGQDKVGSWKTAKTGWRA